MGLKFKLNEKLVQARKEKGVFQEELANICGITRISYSKKERGVTAFTEWEMWKICKALGYSPMEIFFNFEEE